MQQAIRALRLNGGALRVPSATRGIHSTVVNTNPAVIVAGSRHSTEALSSHDVTHSRNITTVVGAKVSPLISSTKLNQFGPRAKANFNTAIARHELSFHPFECNIIFPSLDASAVNPLEIRVPFLPDNFHPARKPEPEVQVTRPVIATVADSTTHIAAPSAIMEGLSFNVSFKEFEVAKDSDKEEEVMMRAFRV